MMAELSNEPVNTCSISFGDPKFQRIRSTRTQVAQHFSTNHRVGAGGVRRFRSPRPARAASTTSRSPTARRIPTYRVCQLARKHVTVALSGDGGDENLRGLSPLSLAHERRARAQRCCRQALRRPLFGLRGHALSEARLGTAVAAREDRRFEALARDSLEGYFHGVSIMPDRLRLPAVLARRSAAISAAIARSRCCATHAARAPTEDPLSLIQYLDFKTYLPGDILVKVDRASMAHSLEVRVPLLDYTLRRLGSGLPPQLKLKGGEGKYIFKKCAGAVPARRHPVSAEDGFRRAASLHWFRGPLRERVRQARAGRVAARHGIFDMSTLRAPRRRAPERRARSQRRAVGAADVLQPAEPGAHQRGASIAAVGAPR